MAAAGLGLEPRYTVPETVVLPLDDPAIARPINRPAPMKILEIKPERNAKGPHH